MNRVLSCIALFFCLLAGSQAQLAHEVGPIPPLHPKFTDANGNPLSGGFLYTYYAGTTTIRHTYADSAGIIQNIDPIRLDSTGAPSNGSVQTQIWLDNNAYKFCAYSAAMVLQWCADGITSYLNILNLTNTWTFRQTFTQPITITQTDQQIIVGAVGNQVTLDFPPPSADVILGFPNVNDIVVARNTNDTLTNKVLISPVEGTPTINGCQEINSPSTYFCGVANASPIGTTLNTLTKLTSGGGVGAAIISSTADKGGVLGICVANCGTSAPAPVIQEDGYAFCTFDAAFSAGDYIQISPTVAGNCHDVGTVYPINGQVIGRAILSGAGAGPINLFGPEIQPSAGGATATFPANTGAGTGPTVTCLSVSCLDRGGVVQVLTGAAPSANGVIFTITFGVTHTTSACVISPANSATAAEVTFITTNNQVTNVTPALTGATTYVWSYNCQF